jgi:hypothetical protein
MTVCKTNIATSSGIRRADIIPLRRNSEPALSLLKGRTGFVAELLFLDAEKLLGNLDGGGRLGGVAVGADV